MLLGGDSERVACEGPRSVPGYAHGGSICRICRGTLDRADFTAPASLQCRLLRRKTRLSNSVRAICLYATWCTASDSPETQQAAAIEFYFYLPRFALQCPDSVYKRFIQELIANLPLMEITKMGGGLQPSDLKRFLADVRQAEDERRRRSRKR